MTERTTPERTATHTTIEAAEEECGWGPWWIAHEHPERPHDRYTVWDWTCDRCMIHLHVAAAMHREGDALHDCIVVDGGPNRHLSLPNVLAEALAWRREFGLPAVAGSSEEDAHG
jgi:hypothetical protein